MAAISSSSINVNNNNNNIFQIINQKKINQRIQVHQMLDVEFY